MTIYINLLIVIVANLLLNFTAQADTEWWLSGTREEIAQFDTPFFINAQKIRHYLESIEIACSKEYIQLELSVAQKLDPVESSRLNLSEKEKTALRLFFTFGCENPTYPIKWGPTGIVNSGVMISGVLFGMAGAADPDEEYKTKEQIIAEAQANPETARMFTQSRDLSALAIIPDEGPNTAEFQKVYHHFKAVDLQDSVKPQEKLSVVKEFETAMEEYYGIEILLYSQLNLPTSELFIKKKDTSLQPNVIIIPPQK